MRIIQWSDNPHGTHSFPPSQHTLSNIKSQSFKIFSKIRWRRLLCRSEQKNSPTEHTDSNQHIPTDNIISNNQFW